MADSITRKLLTKAARANGYRLSYIGPSNHLIVVHDNSGRSEIFYGSRPMRTSANGRMITVNKRLTLDFVKNMGINVPPYILYTENKVTTENFLLANSPIVVKPNDSEKSKGVSVGISSAQQLQNAVEIAKQYSKKGGVILQKQVFGNIYRLFVLNGKLVAASLRQPAFVVGDGKHTTSQLIDQKNQDPLRGDDSSKPLKHIDTAKAYGLLGEEINAVPPLGKKLYVSDIASISAGGDATNVTASVNVNLAKIVGDISQKLGLFVAGFDIICDDISDHASEGYLPLLEINSCPGLRMHAYPTVGQPIDLAGMILNECFINWTKNKENDRITL